MLHRLVTFGINMKDIIFDCIDFVYADINTYNNQRFLSGTMCVNNLNKSFIFSKLNISRRLPKLTIREICDFRQSDALAHDKRFA